MLKDLLPRNAINKDKPLGTCNIMTYELGHVVHSLVYSSYKKKDCELESNAYSGEARINLGDIIVMAEVLCEQLDLNFDAVRKEGIERFRYRMYEIKGGKL